MLILIKYLPNCVLVVSQVIIPGIAQQLYVLVQVPDSVDKDWLKLQHRCIKLKQPNVHFIVKTYR